MKEFLLVITAILISVCWSQSAFIKTETYGSMSFTKQTIVGLNYPQYINIVDSLSKVVIEVYNMTDQTMTRHHELNKSTPILCQYALETVDYGYYTKFPFYRIIASCINQTVEVVNNIKLYRSGEVQFIPGDVVPLSIDQQNCNARPIKVQYFYNSIGSADSFVYRFCQKKQPTLQSLYKEYIGDSKRAYTFKEESIQKITGLTNLSLVDMQPQLGIDGKYNAYLSRNPSYGLIINGGGKYNQVVWRMPGNQVPIKVAKICWTNNLAILTSTNIYFVGVTFYPNQTIAVNQIKKSQILNTTSPQLCNFYTIGHNAVCSLYNGNDTTLYIISENKPGNVTEVIKGKKFQPYVPEDLCATDSFYEGNARYQLIANTVKQNKMNKEKGKIVQHSLGVINGTIANFIDTGSLFLVTLGSPGNATTQTMYVAGYNKSAFHSSYATIRSELINKNISNIQLQFELVSNPYYVVISMMYNDYSTNKSYFGNYYCSSAFYNGCSFSKYLTFQVPVYNVIYLRSASSNSYYYALQTDIEKNAYARLYMNQTYQIRYGYEFQAIQYKTCTIGFSENLPLLYRKDMDGLSVMRVGWRNKNYLVLDTVKKFKQYKFYDVACTHNGLVLSSSVLGKIVLLDSKLQVKSNIQIEFSDFKFTRTLLLVKKGTFVEIRSLQTGQLIQLNKWNLDDLVTNVHSGGFIHKNQLQYYEFINQIESPSPNSLRNENI